MLSPRALRTISELSNVLLLLTTTCAIGLSCVGLLSQAVRTAPNQSWKRNDDTLIIGASYVVVLAASLFICINRRIAVRRRLQRVSKVYRPFSPDDVPKPVHDYIMQEYTRTCLIAHRLLPKDVVHKGWGRPGSQFFGVRFRRALLDTIPEIDELARIVIPTLPPLKPHVRMLHHFRFILPLLPPDDDNDKDEENDKDLDEDDNNNTNDTKKRLTSLHYYDSAIQIARNASEEPTELEFEIGIKAAYKIVCVLDEYRAEMLEGSTSQLSDP